MNARVCPFVPTPFCGSSFYPSVGKGLTTSLFKATLVEGNRIARITAGRMFMERGQGFFNIAVGIIVLIVLAALPLCASASEENPVDLSVFVGDVIMLPESGAALVVLVTEEKDRYLPVTIGQFEASAILRSLGNLDTPRPMTHDLLLRVIGDMGGQLISITVASLDQGTFKALIRIGLEDGSEITMDARPSDSIAIAVKAGAGIFVAPPVMEKAGRSVEGDEEEEGDLRRERPDSPAPPPRIAPETIL